MRGKDIYLHLDDYLPLPLIGEQNWVKHILASTASVVVEYSVSVSLQQLGIDVEASIPRFGNLLVQNLLVVVLWEVH